MILVIGVTKDVDEFRPLFEAADEEELVDKAAMLDRKAEDLIGLTCWLKDGQGKYVIDRDLTKKAEIALGLVVDNFLSRTVLCLSVALSAIDATSDEVRGILGELKYGDVSSAMSMMEPILERKVNKER